MDDKYSMTRNFWKSLLPGDPILIGDKRFFFVRWDGDSAIVVREEVQKIIDKKNVKKKTKQSPPFWAGGWRNGN